MARLRRLAITRGRLPARVGGAFAEGHVADLAQLVLDRPVPAKVAGQLAGQAAPRARLVTADTVTLRQVRLSAWPDRLQDAVLCTHGETIGQLFGQLVADGLVGAASLDWPKGSTWLLQRANQPRVHARYLAPLALGGRAEIA
jgi:hypothetical protein